MYGVRWGHGHVGRPCPGMPNQEHNILRDLLANEVAKVGISPEKEKMWLLPPRPAEDGIGGGAGLSETMGEARRPADVHLPRGAGFSGGKPEALDFAFASGLRRDKLNRTLSNAEDICEDYAEVKKGYKDTDRKVIEEGMRCTPIGFEAHAGGWGLATRQVIGAIAKHQEVGRRW